MRFVILNDSRSPRQFHVKTSAIGFLSSQSSDVTMVSINGTEIYVKENIEEIKKLIEYVEV